MFDSGYIGTTHNPTSLTYDLLIDLYVVQQLPEKEIASRYGTYQVLINRLRKSWGINTITKADRLNLPPITDLQHQLLIGSLMGDGTCHMVGQDTARFAEGHSLKQAGYTRWKAEIMEPFTSNLITATKTDRDGKIFKSLVFYTVSCYEIRKYFDMFYVDGERVFPRGLKSLMSPFVLAVWYMDDGSIANKFHPRISFGLDNLSLQRALAALRGLGFKPLVHEDIDDCLSIEFPGQTDKFYDMVRPHIPACMSYKLPVSSARREKDKNAKKATPERVHELYDGGMSLTDIGKLLNIGRSTVGRRLVELNRPRRKMGRPTGKYSLLASRAALANFDPKEWGTIDTPTQTQWVKDISDILSKTEFPFPQAQSTEKFQHEFAKVCASSLSEENGSIFPWTPIGVSMCSPWFPDRYRAYSKGRKSSVEAWSNPVVMEKMIRFQLDHEDPVLPHRVLRAITMHVRTPSIFRPTVAKYIYEQYCPIGGRTWDPCAGYGGRVIGAAAAGISYVGTDVEPSTVEGNNRLSAQMGTQEKIFVVQHPAETFDVPPVDLVFTSPPYWDRERYSERADQSYNQHGRTFESWVLGFLRPVIIRAAQALDTGRYLLLNVNDLKEGKRVLPLVDRTVSEAANAGFVFEGKITVPLASVNRHLASEPILIFKRK